MTTFRTSCGHEVTVKPVEKVGGAQQGKWIVRVKGPKVTGKSGIKTIYTQPNQADVLRKVSQFLRCSSETLDYHPVASPLRTKKEPSARSPVTASLPTTVKTRTSNGQFDKLEMSPNNRATCRQCDQKIAKDTLRVGLMVFGDPNKVTNLHYYHDQCYPNKTHLRLPGGCSAIDHLAKVGKDKVTQENLLLERQDLWQLLQSLRTAFARRLEVAAFMVFPNKTINEICIKLPTSKAQLFECHGIAEKKWQNFGDSILMIVGIWQSQRSGAAAARSRTSTSTLAMPGVVSSPQDMAAADTNNEEAVQVGETLSCEEIVKHKFDHATKNGYMISID
mmetsp:Transcript_21857/g.36098  ORF Transcript_21857/g.36098 Transcript_21857/m.36098 type:complete len:334 (-) Transcript_21857:373-1374(-)